MKTTEQTALDFGLCTCDEAYTIRGLTAPDCPLHGHDVVGAMEQCAKQKAIAFGMWIRKNGFTDKTTLQLYEIWEAKNANNKQ